MPREIDKDTENLKKVPFLTKATNQLELTLVTYYWIDVVFQF